MRILLLGASGYIGSAVLTELIRHDHTVLALARSDQTEQSLRKSGAEIIRGDLRQPELWAAAVHKVEAIIHVAATFTDDMGDVDRRVMDALILEATKAAHRLRFIYTGGCWLYGQTGDNVATETTPFNPIPAFAWMIANGRAVLQAPCFESIILHPAMTYDRDGGVISRFLTSARENGLIEVWGSLETRWPVVHRKDLANAYRLALEQGVPGRSYNLASEEGVLVGDIARTLALRQGLETELHILSTNDAMAQYGNWAAGPTLDQQMSGQKITAELGWLPVRTNILSEIS